MGLWTDAARPLAEGVDRMIEEDKSFRDGINKVAPYVVGHSVTAVTGISHAGDAAKAATTIAANQAPDLVAKVALAAVLAPAVAVASVVAPPVLLVYGACKWIKDNW